MRHSRLLVRAAAIAAGVVVVAVAAAVLLRGPSDYAVTIRFDNASQLVKGNLVQAGGVSVGEVTDIDLTDDGQAAVRVSITDPDYRPLRVGTLATVRQASLSGVANRYIDLRLPDASKQATIPDGGTIRASATTSAVDLDQLFNTLDARTRRSLQGVIRGFATQYDGAERDANAGLAYLDPSLVASSRLFAELNRDTPLLRRFVGASSQLVTDVAARRDELAGLVDHLSTTTGALARNRQGLGDAVDTLPGFLRRANTTFANLRTALDDLRPLVQDAKPVARRLPDLLAELRPFARDARPTVGALAQVVRRPGADNDLVELTRSTPAVRDIAVGPVTVDGKQREGALPATVKALAQAAPELAIARPYAVDLTGWFDDFSHSGIYDALGGASRAAPYVNAVTNINGVLKPVLPDDWSKVFGASARLNQRNRCPLADEPGTVWKPSADFPCDPSQIPVGGP